MKGRSTHEKKGQEAQRSRTAAVAMNARRRTNRGVKLRVIAISAAFFLNELTQQLDLFARVSRRAIDTFRAQRHDPIV
jgi:hypothetical protein